MRIGYAHRETRMMTASPLVSSPLQAELVPETYQDEARRLQILQMRNTLNSDLEEYTPSKTVWSGEFEANHDGIAAIAQAATLVRPEEVKVVQIHRRRRSRDSDSHSDTDSESSLSLAETLINQSADQMLRDNVFRQTHGDLAYEVEVLMANARADQERLRNWIASMQSVVERLEYRRKSDARLDASLRLLQHAHSVQEAGPQRRSTKP